MTETEVNTENKTGYKKTKLGLIPKDWKLKKLSDVINLESGQHLSPDEYNNEGKGLPYFTGPTDFCSSIDKVTKWTCNGKKYADKGDILITVKGSGVGSLYISNIEKVAIGRQLMAIKPEKIIQGFLYNFLLQRGQVFEILASGNMIPGLSRDDILSFKVPTPPKDQQEKISKIFSGWDEAISKTEKLIKAKKRYKKGLIQRLLSGKVRFPEFEGEDWVEVKLRRFFKSFSNKNKDDEDLRILSCSKVHGITLQSNIFDKRVASKDIKRYKVVERDDLIYDPMLLWDASIGFLKEVDRGVISPAYNTFKFKEKSGYRPFFEYLFDTHYMRYNYKAISQGTNRRRRKAPAQAFLNIDIKVPKSVEEQEKIATVLGTLSKEIELLKEETAMYQKQKKGLMQQLLTGKVRVSNMEGV